MFINNCYFDMMCFVSDDVEMGYFRGCICCGIDGDYWQLWFCRVVNVFVIVNIVVIGCYQCNIFCVVVWRIIV